MIIAALVLAFRGVPAWRGWQREARASAAEQVQEAARAAYVVRQAGVIHDSLAARNRRYLALAPALLSGASAAAAGGSLAGLISGAAASSGVRLGAVQVQADSVALSTFTRIVARGDVTGDVRGITAFLRALERGPAALSVRELSISQPEPAAGPDRAEALRLQVVVSGLAVRAARRTEAEAGNQEAGSRKQETSQ